jgi:hypothetical protein
VDGSTRRTTDEILAYMDVRELKRKGLIAPAQELVEGVARLAWTPCNFGGERPWFVCPDCDRKAAMLYATSAGSGALCRRCANLAYQSQREDAIARAERRAKRALARLGPDGSRPKGMHKSTYRWLTLEYREAVREYEALRQERLGRTEAKRLKRRRRWRRQSGWRPSR